MAKVAFIVPFKPQGKGRPRFSTGNARAYTPEKTKAYEKSIAWHYLAQGGKKLQFAGRPIILTLFARYKKRSTVIGDQAGALAPVKPDIDNVIKAVGDALNDVAWNDDVQIVSVYGAKLFAEDGKEQLDICIQDAYPV
jgi:Holliday junction resolvase RusA-like endonuclease